MQAHESICENASLEGTQKLGDRYFFACVRIPETAIPRVDLFPILISDAIGIAIVCYMFIVSMGKLFAKKHRYRTDPTQVWRW
jgi:hypothetical protein